MVLGATGTGKTNTLFHFIHSCIKNNKKIIIVNGKGDSNIENNIQRLFPNKTYLWKIENNESDFYYDILKGKSKLEITDILLELFDVNATIKEGKASGQSYHSNNELIALENIVLWIRAYNTLLQLLFENNHKISNYYKLPMTINSLATFSNSSFRKDIISKIGKVIPKISKDISYKKELFTNIWKKLQYVNQQINSIDVSYYEQWSLKFVKLIDRYPNLYSGTYVQNQSTNKIKTLEELLTNTTNKNIILFNLNRFKFGEYITPIGKLILLDIKKQTTYLQQKKSNKIMVILDEFGSFATSHVLEFITMGREYGFELVFGLQDLAQLDRYLSPDFTRTFLMNIPNVICHRYDETAGLELICNKFRTYQTFEYTYQVKSEDHAIAKHGSRKAQHVKIINPNDVKTLKVGEAVFMTLNPNNTPTKPIFIQVANIIGTNPPPKTSFAHFLKSRFMIKYRNI